MKKMFILFSIFALAVFAVCLKAQNVNVSPAPATYPDLASAFAAINAGTHTGVITVNIVGNTTETASAVLNASGVGSASYTSITISPTGGAARTITGDLAGTPLIDLNGASNVTIDGLNTGGNSLTITNTSTSNTAGTHTMRLKTDASNNLITNCTILGSSTVAVGNAGSGVIVFGTAAATGNNNNTISYCNISASGVNFPSVLINSSGTSGFVNTNNTITNCNLSDFGNGSAATSGIYIGNFSTAFNITNNRIFRTTTWTTAAAQELNCIYITNTTGSNFLVSGNIIGYASANGTGIFTSNQTAGANYSRFRGIRLNVNSVTASSVQGNTITAIKHTTPGVRTIGIPGGPFVGILVEAGSVNVGTVTGNIIGAASGTGSITLEPTATTGTTIPNQGIYIQGTAGSTVSNNVIGSIDIIGTVAGIHGFVGIYQQSTGTVTISNNTIGNSTSNNITSTLTGTGINAGLMGIRTQSGSNIVTGNTIQNITHYGANIGVDANASVVGFFNASQSSGTLLFSGNIIRNLSNAAATASSVQVTGVFWNSAPTAGNLLEKCQIYGLSVASTSDASIIRGIYTTLSNGSPAASIRNNFVSLGDGITTSPIIVGIDFNPLTNTSINYYFNSVRLLGAPATGSGNSYAFRRTADRTADIRNNIFVNERSNSGGSGTHYSISLNSNLVLTIDYNDYYANGTGGVLGSLGGDQTTLLAWQTATGQDINSKNVAVTFAGTTDLHLSGASIGNPNLLGTTISGITDDIDGDLRKTTPLGPYVGADEDPVPLPIELQSFTAVIVKGKAVLKWKTVSEVNSAAFEVERKSINTSWSKIGEVAASGNSNSPKDYSFTDQTPASGRYEYRLKMIDADGSYRYSSIIEVEVGLPKEYSISQNYPNPFNPTTRIDYQLPFNSNVSIELYGITGEKIATWINGNLSAGYYSTEVNANALNLASGVYIYTMTANGGNNQTFTQVKKLMLTK